MRAVEGSAGPSEDNVDEQAVKDHRWSLAVTLLLELFEQPAVLLELSIETGGKADGAGGSVPWCWWVGCWSSGPAMW